MSKVIFDPKRWQTEHNVLCPNQIPPGLPGIYAFVLLSVMGKGKGSYIQYDVLYIGMSKRLNTRIYGHLVLKRLRQIYGHVNITIYYQVHEGNLREIEAKAIRKLDPIYNIVHKDPFKSNLPLVGEACS